LIGRRLVLHPLLFAAAPVLSLMASNLQELHPVAGRRALLALVLGTALVLLLLGRWIREKQRAAMICSLFLLLFFSYGHVYFGLVTQSTRGLFTRLGLVGNHLVLGISWLAFFAVGVGMTLRVKMHLKTLARVMNLMAIASFVIPLIQIARFERQFRQSFEGGQAVVEPYLKQNLGRADKPDIYYIVLDGYGRQDILEQLYQFENSSFLTSLEAQGFFVADEARSNYVQTSLSVASSLNLSYIQDAYPDANTRDPRPTLARMIRDSAVRTFLERQGYQIVAFAPGYRPTELRDADRFFSGRGWAVNPLEGLLLETSAFAAYQHLARKSGLPQYYPGYTSHRELISFTLAKLPETATLPGPKFVFAHIVIPHPPFVFDEQGGTVPQRYRFSFMDGDAFQGTKAAYIEGYREQVSYLNHRLEALIADLLSRSERPPVIILQGDHGPGLQLNYQSAEESNLEERLGILNAIHMPGEGQMDMPEDITPVNTFRLIFNRYFQTELPTLPDRSYYSTWSQPLDFLLVP
jgi:hypothetical protein